MQHYLYIVFIPVHIVLQPQPGGVHKPQPTGLHQLQPAGVHKPQPAGVHQPISVDNRNPSMITDDGMLTKLSTNYMQLRLS